MCAACTEKPCSDHSSLTTEVPSVPPPPAAERNWLSPASAHDRLPLLRHLGILSVHHRPLPHRPPRRAPALSGRLRALPRLDPLRRRSLRRQRARHLLRGLSRALVVARSRLSPRRPHDPPTSPPRPSPQPAPPRALRLSLRPSAPTPPPPPRPAASSRTPGCRAGPSCRLLALLPPRSPRG